MNNLIFAHCRGQFFREFAYKKLLSEKYKPSDDLSRIKVPIMNEIYLNKIVSTMNSRPGLYISIYSFSEKNENGVVYSSAKLNRLYLDFDNEINPQQAITEALIVARSLNRHGIFCHCYFSGLKGIALYIEFKTIDLNVSIKKDVLKLFFKTISETVKADFNYDIANIDLSVISDLARVSRLPNTKHASGFYCIPITFGDMKKGLAHIKNKAMKPSNIDLESIISNCILRNWKMPIIMANLEKQVTCSKEAIVLEKKLKDAHLARIKPFFKSKTGNITEEQISNARNYPLSKLLGTNVRMKCPIHVGDNPTSFYIDHSKNYWYCHSCSKGGNAVDFIMHKEKLSFIDAVKLLIQ